MKGDRNGDLARTIVAIGRLPNISAGRARIRRNNIQHKLGIAWQEKIFLPGGRAWRYSNDIVVVYRR